MTRRGFLQAGAAAAGPSRPNVLTILCDQLNPAVTSVYGGPVRTPNLERLASRGVVFTNATCPTTFCSPSRASIVTGQYPHRHGIVYNVSRIDYPVHPLVVSWPGKIRAGRTEAAANLADVAPTILELTGRSVPAGMQGQSRAPQLLGHASAAQQVFRLTERVRQNPQRTRQIGPGAMSDLMIRGEGWKYMLYMDGEEFLYDLKHDPGETRNLAAERSAGSRKQEMRLHLKRELQRTEFPGRVHLG